MISNDPQLLIKNHGTYGNIIHDKANNKYFSCIFNVLNVYLIFSVNK